METGHHRIVGMHLVSAYHWLSMMPAAAASALYHSCMYKRIHLYIYLYLYTIVCNSMGISNGWWMVHVVLYNWGRRMEMTYWQSIEEIFLNHFYTATPIPLSLSLLFSPSLPFSLSLSLFLLPELGCVYTLYLGGCSCRCFSYQSIYERNMYDGKNMEEVLR